ncbi:MAG: hypothetical protein RLY86_4024, partial [Pseudomonadota bacterium]
RFENIVATVVGNDGPVQTSIGLVTATSASKPSAAAAPTPAPGAAQGQAPASLLDLTGGFTAERLLTTGPEGERIAIAGLTGNLSLSGTDIATMMEASARLQETQPDPVTGKVPPERMDQMLAALGDMLGAYGHAGSLTMSLKGLEVVDGAESVRMESLTTGFAAGATDGSGRLGMTLGFGGLALAPAQEPAALVPGSMAIDIALEQLPMAQLKPLLTEFMRLSADPSQMDAAGQVLAMQMIAALSQAGSRLALADLKVETPGSGLTGSGAVTVDQAAALGATANVTFTIRNLDAAIQALGPKPGEPTDPEAAGTLMALGMVQGFGQPGTDGEGRPVLTYRIQATPQGQLLLNGQDLAPMLQAMQQMR